MKEQIRYYNEFEPPYGCLSNYARVHFELDGVWWPSAEHCYHAHKFTGDEPEHQDARRRIYEAPTPREAKRVAHEFDAYRRRDWDAVRDDVMRRIVLRKFESNADIARVLLSTGDAELIEESRDHHWGCGENGTGHNMLGRILMEVRAKLRAPPLPAPPPAPPLPASPPRTGER